MPARLKTIAKPTEQMDFMHSVKLLEQYEIPMVASYAAFHEQDLVKIAARLPYPWAMKAAGKHLIHKSDAGGVKLNLSNSHEAMMALHDFAKIPNAEYAIVQPMRKGIELIVGGKRDPQFGPTVLIGMGGIYTEVFKDSSLRIAPIRDEDIASMIQELKIYPILHGVRGQPGIHFGQLHQLLKGVSRLMVEKNIAELDLNPVIATPTGVKAVDVRIIE